MPETMQIRLADDAPGVGRRGDLVTLSLTPDDVHSAEELSTFIAGYHPTGYRADEASKVIPVDHDKDKYRKMSSNDAFRLVNVEGAIEGAVPEVDPSSSLTNLAVVDQFIGSFVNDVVAGNATKAYRPRQAAGKRCRNAIQLWREKKVWDLLTTAAGWATAQKETLTSGYEWNGGANSDPIQNLQDRIDASLQMVTDIWMNQHVSNVFLRHPLVKDHMRQMLGDNPVAAAVTNVHKATGMPVDYQIPGLPPIHVVAGKYLNESTSTHDWILGNANVVLTTSPPGVPQDEEEIATSVTFRRKGVSGVGFDTREYRVENRGPKGGTMVVCHTADIAVMLANDVGGLLVDVIQ